MAENGGGVSILILPEEGGDSRTIRVSRSRLRVLFYLGVVGAVVFGFLAVSWVYFAVNTAKNWQLQALVDSLQGERSRVFSLAEELTRVQAEYDHLRGLFGSADSTLGSDIWLPPTGVSGNLPPASGPPSDTSLPTAWPLTESGFITQPLVAGGVADHPGLDIAVPTDSYIRAAGSGRVLRVGEDPVYGRFVVLEHGDGYQTVYGHASSILVERGWTVRRQEVIALSGSTGHSTAPHLHFEILLDGVPVDPLSLVEQPG